MKSELSFVDATLIDYQYHTKASGARLVSYIELQVGPVGKTPLSSLIPYLKEF